MFLVFTGTDTKVQRSLPIGSDDFVGELETKTNKNLRFTKQGRPSV